MGSTTDQIKGRAKESIGRATGNRDLENEGTADRVGGKLKEGVDQVKDALTGKHEPRRRP